MLFDVAGVLTAHIYPIAGARFCKVPRGFRGFTPPSLSTDLSALGLSDVTLSQHLQRGWTTSAVGSVPGSLRREKGIPNVNSDSRSVLTTFSAVLLGSGQQNRNFLVLPTTTRRYLFPASDLAPMSVMPFSRTSQGLRKRAGSMATRWLVDFLILCHPQEST